MNICLREKIEPREILDSAMPIIALTTSPPGAFHNLYECPFLDNLKSQLLCIDSPRLMLQSQLPVLDFSASASRKGEAEVQKPIFLPDLKPSVKSNQDSSFPFTKTVNGLEVVFIGKNQYYPISPGYTGDLALDSIKKYIPLIKKYSSQIGLDPAIPLAIMRIESGGNPNAVSNQGALGLMQITQDTARQWGLSDPLNTENNIKTGIKILHYYFCLYKGNTALMAAAYNAGAGAVSKYDGVPDYTETEKYINNFNYWYSFYKDITN